MAKQRIEYLAVDRLDIERTLVSGGSEVNLNGLSGEKSKVSSNDTTAGYLNGKLVAGANVTLTENNNGGDETLTIAANFTDVDDKAKVSSNDTTAGYLNGKLVAGTNITLTENNNGGNETLTIAAAGGVTGFAASQNITSPNDVTNASRLLVDASTTNADMILQVKGLGAYVAQLPDNTTTGGNKRGASAIDFGRARTAADQVASGTRSVIIGYSDNKASGYGAYAIGQVNTVTADGAIALGSSNVLSPAGDTQYCFGGNNTSSGLETAIHGKSNTVSGERSTAIGFGHIVSGNRATAIGDSNQASAKYSGAWGGYNNRATAEYAQAYGRDALADCFNMRAYALAYPFGSTPGYQQYQEMIVRADTTNAISSAVFTADGQTTTGAPYEMTVPADTNLHFDIMITARHETNDQNGAWKITGMIKQHAGTTAFVGTPTTTVIADGHGTTWTLTVSAVAGILRLTANSNLINGGNIRWLAHIKALKLTF